MRLRAAPMFMAVTFELSACNYVIGYNKLRKANRLLVQLPDGALAVANATDVQVGAKHSCATFDDGSLRCWGKNDAGQLGVGGTDSQLSATVVPEVHDVASISLGDRHTCAILESGDAYCWGANDLGQLGLGFADEGAHDRPARAKASPAARVQAGRGHTCIETRAGAVECWGEGDHAQLGAPIAVEGWSALSESGEHACGIRDGVVHCFGRNDEGQLGLGHRTDAPTPTPLTF